MEQKQKLFEDELNRYVLGNSTNQSDSDSNIDELLWL